LQTDEGERLESGDAERLIWRRTGWVIPVASLRYWILGMPAGAASPEHVELDDRGRIEQLRSGAWTVDYSDYHAIGAMDDLMLPAKVHLKSPDWQIKVAVRQWEFF
jgi:outer membrane lipoprotein LolB